LAGHSPRLSSMRTSKPPKTLDPQSSQEPSVPVALPRCYLVCSHAWSLQVPGSYSTDPLVFQEYTMSELKEVDKHICSILQDSARIQLSHIAEQVGMSIPAISEHVRKLEELGIIHAYLEQNLE
jgi:DNA-binding transcriptional ArsR family regulator